MSSARLTRDAGSDLEFSTLTYRIDQRYRGESIRLEGVLRTAAVVGYTGLWLRLDGVSGPLEFDNMADANIDGTRDWQAYSIALPLNPDARKIVFGVLLAGEGTVWADDLVLSIDGVPVDEAGNVPRKLTALDLDTEFDEGSGIGFDSLGDRQVASLVLLGKVWGFLKYHHPAVTGGEHHWDYELLRVMPEVLAASSATALQDVLAEWVAGLGPIDACDPCASEARRTHLVPRLDWLDDEHRLGNELRETLHGAHENRPSVDSTYFVETMPPVGDCELPQALSFVERQLTVLHPVTDDGVLVTGDVIESIDGRPVGELVDDVARYYPASNQAARRRHLAWKLSHGECGTTPLDVLRDGERLQVDSERIARGDVDWSYRWSADRAGPAFQMLSDDVAYLKLSATGKARIPAYLEQAAGTRGIVIDVRGYPAEMLVFALGQHLVDADTPFATFTRPDVSNPGAFVWGPAVSLSPQEPYYAGRVALLVNEITQSNAEYTTMAYRVAKDAVVVGSTTAGADGNYSRIAMPGGVYGGISGLGVFYPDQRQTQRIGILPDVRVSPTVEGIRAGRDEVLEAGIAAILADDADPDEIRRMARRP